MNKLFQRLMVVLLITSIYFPPTIIRAESFPIYFNKYINNEDIGGGNQTFYGKDHCFYSTNYAQAKITKLCGDTFTTIAGYNQENRTSPDGSLAVQANVNQPFAIAVNNEGVVFFSELGSHLIRSITTDGILHTVAGDGSIDGPVFDATDARQTSFPYPSKISIGADDLPYISDGSLVRRLNADGSTTHVVGYIGSDSSAHPFIDGGAANSMVFPAYSQTTDNLNSITAFDSLGRLYVTGSDLYNTNQIATIYRVELDGTIHKILGGGQDGSVSYSHDRAFSDAEFPFISGLAISNDGTIWLGSGTQGIFVARNNQVHLASGQGTQYLNGPNYAHSGMDTKFSALVSSLAVTESGYLYFTQQSSAIAILFTDYVTPTMTPSVNNAGVPSDGWYRLPVTIHWGMFDPELSSGIPNPPSDTNVSSEGKNQVINSPLGCDGAGNCTSTSVTVSIDKTPGTVASSSAPILLPNQAFTGTATDSLSGVSYVRVAFEFQNNPDVVYDSRYGNISLSCNPTKTSCTWSINQPYPPAGAYSAAMYTGDIAGNESNEVVQNVVVF